MRNSPTRSGYEDASTNDSLDSGGSGGSSGSSGSNGSSGSSGSGRSNGDLDAMLVTYDGPPPNVDGGQLSCATPDGLTIKFNPMYSGFDGTHTYQVPSFVSGWTRDGHVGLLGPDDGQHPAVRYAAS